MAAFGIHISKQSLLGDYSTLESAVDDIVSKYDLNACQIFTHGPQSRNKNHYNAEALRAISQDKAKIFVHSTYLTDGYWNAVDEMNSSKLKSNYKHIQDQLDATAEIGGAGLVIHITRKKIAVIKTGMKLLEKYVRQPDGVKIILEFKAMKPGPDCSYETALRLNALCEALRPNTLEWGFCIDTSHQWATGFHMENAKVVADWLRDIAPSADKVALFHLNAANIDTFGVGKDVHIVPFSPQDSIWGKNKESLGILLAWAKKNKVPIVSEFKRNSIQDVEFAIKTIQTILD